MVMRKWRNTCALASWEVRGGGGGVIDVVITVMMFRCRGPHRRSGCVRSEDCWDGGPTPPYGINRTDARWGPRNRGERIAAVRSSGPDLPCRRLVVQLPVFRSLSSPPRDSAAPSFQPHLLCFVERRKHCARGEESNNSHYFYIKLEKKRIARLWCEEKSWKSCVIKE